MVKPALQHLAKHCGSELATLTRISDIALSSDTLRTACRLITEEISASTGFPVVVIERYDAAREVMAVEGATGVSQIETHGLETPVHRSLSGGVVLTCEPVIKTCPEDAASVLVCVPMLVGTEVIGAMSLAHPSRVSYVEDVVPWLRSLANFVATLIERKRTAHEQLELVRVQAARAQAEAAIQARDEFLSVAAHELRTPVAALRAYSQLLARRAEHLDSADSHQHLRDGITSFAEQTEKLTRLVGQLMDVSRLGAGKLAIERSESDVAASVRAVVAAAQAVMPDHRIVVDAPPTLLARVDGLRLEQVLTNLLSNALRYSPPGGDIQVELTREPNNSLRLAVRDHGPGISAEHRARIFERFYQVDTEHSSGGMGLGLYISSQIVEQHGGRLSLETPIDGGTVFVAHLPT